MVHRLLELKKILKNDKSAFLLGPRGVGKTLLSKEFISKEAVKFEIDLLKLDIYTRYLTDLTLFRNEIENKIPKNGALTVFIDEVQKLPQLLDEVHYLIEKHKKKVRFLLTGSSARKLKRGGANLLAGRALSLKLHPLTHLEYSLDLNKILSIGSLPGVLIDNDSPERSLKSYVETYLKEEILQEALVRKIEGYIKFLDIAGQMNGEPVNFSKIAKNCGVTTKTVQEFYSILVDTMLAFQINAWSYSIRKQLRLSPKFYLFDCGVLNSITGELTTELKPRSYRYGKLFETFVIQELIRLNDYWETDFKFFYWRTNTGLEVDIILSKGPKHPPLAIEIKSEGGIIEKDLYPLKSFKSENPKARLFCLCTTPETYKVDNIEILPWKVGIEKILKNSS